MDGEGVIAPTERTSPVSRAMFLGLQEDPGTWGAFDVGMEYFGRSGSPQPIYFLLWSCFWSRVFTHAWTLGGELRPFSRSGCLTRLPSIFKALALPVPTT